MDNKKKYFLLLTLLSLSLLIISIILSFPVEYKEDTSIFGDISILFWVFLLSSTILLVYTCILMKSKLFSLFSGTVFFLLIYSMNLLFKIVPAQRDIGYTGVVSKYLKNTIHIDTSINAYFNFPIKFMFHSITRNVLNTSDIVTVNIGFFIFLLAIPAVLALVIHKGLDEERKVVLFTFPIAYIIFTFFFINAQFVPQFLGLVFLIALTGAYIQLVETNKIQYYFLTLFFYILCVYTHPFMFTFFLLALFYIKLFNFLRNPLSTYIKIIKIIDIKKDKPVLTYLRETIVSYYHDKKKITSFIRRSLNFTIDHMKKRIRSDVSMILLVIIYYIAYVNGLYKMRILDQFLNPLQGRGETWFLVARFIGDKSAVGLLGHKVYPLYDVISRDLYLTFRYLSMLILFILLFFTFISIIRTVLKKIHPFDILLFLSTFIFIIAGFFNSSILGQRSLQATFLGVSKYSYNDKNLKPFMKIIGVLVIMITPLIFSINICISHTINGGMFIEDNTTLYPGYFIEDYNENLTIMMADRGYNPATDYSIYNRSQMERVDPETIYEPNFNENSVDVYINNIKFRNRLTYHGLSPKDVMDDNSTIYDQGRAQIEVNEKIIYL